MSQTIIDRPSQKDLQAALDLMGSGSASSIADNMVALLNMGGEDSESVFKDMSIHLMTTTVRILVDLRDNGLITLDQNTWRDWMALENLMLVSPFCEKGYAGGNPQIANARSVHALQPETLEYIEMYLRGLPGFEPFLPPHEQDPHSTGQMVGYGIMYWNRILRLLSDAAESRLNA